MPENPWLSLVTCVDTCSIGKSEYTTDFYTIGFKKVISGNFYYGRTRYDHSGGSMIYVKPGQVVELNNL